MGSPGTPWITYLLAVGILWTAYAYTGFTPTEETLTPLAWDSGDLEAGNARPLFTSLFAHAGLLHLGFNLIALLAFGGLLEQTIGHFRFTLIYLLAGVGANVIHAYLLPGVPVVGASGAIFGVMGTLVLLRPLVWTMLLFLIPLPLLFASALYVALAPILAALDPYVAHAAHLAGMGIGMACAILLAPLRSLAVLLSWVVVAAATYLGVGYGIGLWMQRETFAGVPPLDLALVLAPLALALLVIWFTHRNLRLRGFAE